MAVVKPALCSDSLYDVRHGFPGRRVITRLPLVSPTPLTQRHSFPPTAGRVPPNRPLRKRAALPEVTPLSRGGHVQGLSQGPELPVGTSRPAGTDIPRPRSAESLGRSLASKDVSKH